jgi:hypothetical protein
LIEKSTFDTHFKDFKLLKTNKNITLFENIYQIHGERALQNSSERGAQETRIALHNG